MATIVTTPALPPVPAIELRGLVKDFSIGLRGVKLRAVDHLNLSVAAGQVFGLLGPNGSGKSTTIKIILGLLEVTAGTATVFGVPSGQIAARQNVGYLPESPYFYRHLTGRELVAFCARLCGLGESSLADRVREVVTLVGMTDGADRRVGTYSKGMLQRIGLAQALVHDPRLVILDEPTAGVDPVGAAVISEIILSLKARGKTVLITSHLLGQIEDICDHVAIMDRGRLLLAGAMRDLVGGTDRQALLVDKLAETDLADLRAWLAARGHALEVTEQVRDRLDKIFLRELGRSASATKE